MIFSETPLKGAFVIDIEPHADDRGFFSRTYCTEEFKRHGLSPVGAQCSLSFNAKEGTLRGMHFQASPMREAKLVRCTSGAIHDVIIDLRADSPTYKKHFAVQLYAANRRSLYVPESFAHGFQTLADESEVLYQMSTVYTPGYARGVPYDDPAFAIRWPIPVTEISEQDTQWEPFS